MCKKTENTRNSLEYLTISVGVIKRDSCYRTEIGSLAVRGLEELGIIVYNVRDRVSTSETISNFEYVFAVNTKKNYPRPEKRWIIHPTTWTYVYNFISYIYTWVKRTGALKDRFSYISKKKKNVYSALKDV